MCINTKGGISCLWFAFIPSRFSFSLFRNFSGRFHRKALKVASVLTYRRFHVDEQRSEGQSLPFSQSLFKLGSDESGNNPLNISILVLPMVAISIYISAFASSVNQYLLFCVQSIVRERNNFSESKYQEHEIA